MTTTALPPHPAKLEIDATGRPAIEFYRAENYVPEDSVGYMIRRIVNLVGLDIERQLAASDLTNAQWVPLFRLYLGQASTIVDLARSCQLDASAMTRLLDRLEAKGLCRRVRSLEDRRVVNIELTGEGVEAARAIPGVLSCVQNAHLAGFSFDEFETLKSYLRRILDNAQAVSDTALVPGEPRSPE